MPNESNLRREQKRGTRKVVFGLKCMIITSSRHYRLLLLWSWGYLYFDAGAKNAFRVTRDFNLIPPYVGKKTRLGGRENTPLCSYFHAPAGNDTGGFLPPCPCTKGYFHACFKSAGFYLAGFYLVLIYKRLFSRRFGDAVVLSGIVLSQLVDPLSPTSHITL